VSITAATPHADGTVMVHDAIQGNVAGWRTWLTPLAVAEVPASTIVREKIARPRIAGFPIGGFEGQSGLCLTREYGLRSPDALADDEWGMRPDRLNIMLRAMGANARWVLPIGATFYIPRSSSRLKITGTLQWQVRGQEGAAAGAVYPSGGGAGAIVGEFKIATRLRGQRWTPSVHQVATVYPAETAGSGNDQRRIDRDTICTDGDIAVGTWDVALLFDKDAACPANTLQVSVSRMTLKIEAHF
jgi:hypothetical protein